MVLREKGTAHHSVDFGSGFLSSIDHCGYIYILYSSNLARCASDSNQCLAVDLNRSRDSLEITLFVIPCGSLDHIARYMYNTSFILRRCSPIEERHSIICFLASASHDAFECSLSWPRDEFDIKPRRITDSDDRSDFCDRPSAPLSMATILSRGKYISPFCKHKSRGKLATESSFPSTDQHIQP